MSKIQVVGVSMDRTDSILDWIDSNPDLKEFDVPLMSDRWIFSEFYCDLH